MNRIRVPLAVDAQVRVPVGPALLPLRTVLILAAASPLAFLWLQAAFLEVTYRIGCALVTYMLAFTLAMPTREGVWIGTWCTYRIVQRALTTAVVAGAPYRGRVRVVQGAVEVADLKPLLGLTTRLKSLARLSAVPTVSTVEPGVIRLSPGGARAVLMLDGVAGSLTSDVYAAWCTRVVRWLLSLECPAQLIGVVSHHDSHRAQLAFDRETERWPRTPLLDFERGLAGRVAAQSVGFRHYVVLAPGSAAKDGVPLLSSLLRASKMVDASDSEALRALQLAVRLAAGAELAVTVPDRDDLAGLVGHTVLGASGSAIGSDGVLHVGEQHQAVLTATRLPPVVHQGMLAEALMRSRARGLASLHILPVDPAVARKVLDRRLALQRYAAREGNTGVDNEVAAADTMQTLAALARRDLQPCRIALTLALTDHEHDRLLDCGERVIGLLHGQGFEMIKAGSPGFLPALATSPGGAPLGRSVQLTSDDVASCLLPTLGTPFTDIRQPLVGISELTGSAVYLSVWSRPNHNAVIVGSSGAGKSVSTKTLLIRHVLQQASAVVIDPDSEYGRTMHALGGRHLELGDEALNPLSPAVQVAPDIAAGLVLPVLSVMAGDEKGVREGRPIRRLPDEDQGWLHRELATFFRSWTERAPSDEPLVRDLVQFIEQESGPRSLTRRERERSRVITARLRRFTQGDRARFFDRHSTFKVGSTPIAIGLRQLSMSYAADLTPALAVVLTAVLSALGRGDGRLIVVVDEAHRVTSDPDAGDVLGQLVRQARKYGAGVWMCSQRVEDFVGTDLGRTLAATAATKLLLGVEEAALPGLRETFSLSDEEMAAVNPPVQGRAVLISGAERTVVRVMPGNAILSLADTGMSARDERAAERAG